MLEAPATGETFILFDRGERYTVQTGPAAGGRPGYVTRVRRADGVLGDWQVITTQPAETIRAAKVWHAIFFHREEKREAFRQRVQIIECEVTE